MKKVNSAKVECLREDCFLCKNISSDWLKMVRTQRDVLSFKKGEHIFKEGNKVEGIYFILNGKVKIDMSWGDKSYIVRLASDGEILGHRGYGIDDIYPISATALEPTTACFIPTDLFLTLLKTNTELLYSLALFYADELKFTERRMKNLAHMQVKCRVAEAIGMIAKAFGIDDQGTLGFQLTRKEIAAMAGTTYETVIRTLNELVKDELIELDGKSIMVLDEAGLNRLCTQQSVS